jgi:hypothetical protein
MKKVQPTPAKKQDPESELAPDEPESQPEHQLDLLA